MALSPQDRAYYESKLSWKGFLYLLVVTVVMGGLLFPLFFWLQDYTAGRSSHWTFIVVRDLAVNGMILGAIVSPIMFFIARLYLWLGWLPPRH